MDKRLYVAWNNYTHHQFGCQKRNKWLDIFLTLVFNEQRSVPQFFRGMSSVLTEQLLRDVAAVKATRPAGSGSGSGNSGSSGADSGATDAVDDVDCRKLIYCLRRRGWLLLNALASSDLKYLTAAAELVELLISLYKILAIRVGDGVPEAPSAGAQSPLADLASIVRPLDRHHADRRMQRRRSVKGSSTDSEVSDEDGDVDVGPQMVARSDPSGRCCENESEESSPSVQLVDGRTSATPRQVRRSILSLLESIMCHHGDVSIRTGLKLDKLDELVLNFALEQFGYDDDEDESRAILRLILRCMVSLVQRNRSSLLRSGAIVQLLVEKAWQSARTRPTLALEIVESLLRFLVQLSQSVDLNQFSIVNDLLHEFHSCRCVELLTSLAHTEAGRFQASLTEIGRLVTNVMAGQRKILDADVKHSPRHGLPHHHSDSCGRPFAEDGAQNCNVASLFYLLLRIYCAGSPPIPAAALEAMKRGGSCCCLPPATVYRHLLDRLPRHDSFLDVLERSFDDLGLACSSDETCQFCRRNGGLEEERIYQTGAYSSDEALHPPVKPAESPDAWKWLDDLLDLILKHLEQPMTLSLIQQLKRLMTRATPHVRFQVFNRIVYPIVLQSNGSRDQSLSTQILDAGWQMCAALVRQQRIADALIDSNGLELLLDLSRSPDWIWNVSRVLESLIVVHFRSKEPAAANDQLTPLILMEHLLSQYLLYVFQVLERQSMIGAPVRHRSSSDTNGNSGGDWNANIMEPVRHLQPSEWTSTEDDSSAAESRGIRLISPAWTDHLNGLERAEANLRIASALWESAARLAVNHLPFHHWLQNHALCWRIKRGLLRVAVHLNDPKADHWIHLTNLLECFLTLSMTLSSGGDIDQRLMAIIQRYPAGYRNLRLVCERILRCSTLERWTADRGALIDRAADQWEATRWKPRILTPEDGYEADEEPHRSESGSESIRGRSGQPSIAFPSLYAQLLESFAHWFSSVDPESACGMEFLDDFFRLFSRMASLASRPSASALLNQHGIQAILLSALKPVLVCPAASARGIRQLILKISGDLIRQRVTTDDLQSLIDLFKEDHPPLAELLPILLDAVQLGGQQPTHWLGFPDRKVADPDSDSMVLSSASMGSISHLQEIRQEVHSLARSAKELGRLHDEKGIGSAWKSAAVFLPILTDHNWNLRTDGVSASLWFLVAPARQPEASGLTRHHRSDPDWMVLSQVFQPEGNYVIDYSGHLDSGTSSCPTPVQSEVHLFSVGTKGFLIEFWSDPCAESIVVRVTQSTGTTARCLGSRPLDLRVPGGQWHHLAVNCYERPPKQPADADRTIHVIAILNGSRAAVLELDVPLPQVKRHPSHSFLLIGLARNRTEPYRSSWYLGHVTLFRGPILTAEKAVLLTALGADSVFVASCLEKQPSPNLARCLHAKLAGRPIDWNGVFNHGKLLESLQQQLILTYSSHKPESVFIYPSIISPTAGLFGTILSGGVNGVFNAVSSDPRSSQQPPIALPVAMATEMSHQVHAGIRTSLKQLGGYQVLLFLLGHVIGLDRSTDELQAKALDVLLRWLRSDAQEMNLFQANHGLLMLERLFQSSRCGTGQHAAAVLLNASCSSAIVTPSGGHLRVTSHSPSVVADPTLLGFVLQSWRHWQRKTDAPDSGSTLELVLRAFQSLLRDDHPHREFNVAQMKRGRVLQLLLQMAKESALYEECRPLTAFQTVQVADVIEGLIGSPPQIDALEALVEYLILLHPAAQTYAANASGYYYFLLSSRDAGADLYKCRAWNLPDGYLAYAPEIQDELNGNKLSAALSRVRIKWSSGVPGGQLSDQCDECDDPSSARQLLVLPKALKEEPQESEGWHVVSQQYVPGAGPGTETEISLSKHLLRILTACIRVLPDSMVKQVVGTVIRPEMLIVMAHHNRSSIRAAVIKLLHSVLLRNSDEEQKFIRNYGLILLSNQLQPFRATADVVEACLSLCVGIDVQLEQLVDPLIIWPDKPTSFQLQSMTLLLALLPNSACDPALFHHLVSLLRTLCSKSNSVLKFLLEIGLVESLGRTLIALAHTSRSPKDILERREDEVLVDGVQRLLVLVASRTLYASGLNHWMVFQDMMLLFHYLERVETGLCGPKSRCVRMIRESACVVLRQASDVLQDHTVNRSVRMGSAESNFIRLSDRFVANALPQSLNRKLQFDRGAGRSEIMERFRSLLIQSVDHATLNVEREHSTAESNFAKGLFLTLLHGLSSILERPKAAVRTPESPTAPACPDWSQFNAPESSDWHRQLFWSCKEIVQAQLGRLLLFMSSPLQDPSVLYFVIRSLHEDPLHEEVLRMVGDADFRNTLSAYLGHFLHSNWTENVDHTTLIRMHCISQCLSQSNRVFQVLDVHQLRNQRIQERDHRWKLFEEYHLRILQRFDSLYRHSAEAAVRMTHETVEFQHDIRRQFLDTLRVHHQMLATNSWRKLVDQMTHERAPWHFPKSYFRAWQLDPTEGFQRTHLRLQRCALHIDKKYVLSRSRNILEPEQQPQPLEYLFASGHPTSVDSSISAEKILRVVNCSMVGPSADLPGELALTVCSLMFLVDRSGIHSNGSVLTWSYEDIREVHPRRYELQERAVEIFAADHRTAFFVFGGSDERNGVLRHLSEHCRRLLPAESLPDVTQMWRENLITNFEYLTFLNKAAGRTYNDLMQYPIFPFVLAEYESATLNLQDPNVYRNFKRPMAVQNESRDQHYVENYNYLKRDFENRPEGSPAQGPNLGPFHYGSLYSNPGIVLHFLVRLPPFTKMLMDYQDRNFDVPDRSFHSIGVSWRLASSDSTTDVKELIPEFFFLPEFLNNRLGFDFGTQQSGEPVDDVQLPPWCHGDARLFVLIHRQALESSWVRDHLQHWIDLIFGYKQNGPPAVDAINVFHPATYAGFDLNGSTDPIEANARLTMIRSYGQVPRQLFRNPHPMPMQSLSAKAQRKSQLPLRSVEGLQWGCYVGSPACPDPVVKHTEAFSVPIHSFVPLRTGDTYALGPCTVAIVAHSYDKDSFLGKPTGIVGVGLVLWGQADGIVRIKIRKDQPIKPLFQSEAGDSVVHCCTAPDYQHIWVAYRSGLIRVYPFKFDPVRSHFELTGPPTVLVGHRGPAHHIQLCTAFSNAVTGGRDGTVIIWDLHRLTYIRQFTPHQEEDTPKGRPVTQLAVSRTLGDVACVTEPRSDLSFLELRSINGALIASANCSPLITSLCFSSSPEGVSINCLAAGLADGTVRLWNAWNLGPIRDIPADCGSPVTSLSFSSDSQHLLAARNDGSVTVWDSPHNKRFSSLRYPPLINLTLQ